MASQNSDMQRTIAKHSERITRLETQYIGIQESMNKLSQSMDNLTAAYNRTRGRDAVIGGFIMAATTLIGSVVTYIFVK